MNYAKISRCNTCNGLGVRVVLWVTGCNHYCKGCHNAALADPNAGLPFDDEAEALLFSYLDSPHIQGITFSGGDPMLMNNRSEVYRLCIKIRKRYGSTKDIWIYTGYQFDLLNYTYKENQEVNTLADYVVDGEFELDNRDVTLAFRGSTNQRIVNVNETLKQGHIVILDID